MKLKPPTTAPAIGSTGTHSERGPYTVIDIVGCAAVVRYADTTTGTIALDTLQTRVCTTCGQEKQLDLFTRVTARPCGHGRICLACDSARVSEIRSKSATKTTSTQQRGAGEATGAMEKSNGY